MKGIVFTEFLEMVEDKFGYEMVDQIIGQSELESGGAYTSVGTYNHAEIVSLITNLSINTGLEVQSLLKAFGSYFFDVMINNYGQFFKSVNNSFELLHSIENHIHVEVKKLYPDAELPSFDSDQTTENELKLLYTSERKMADFAHGLIERTINYYQETATITKKSIEADGSIVQFTITKIAA